MWTAIGFAVIALAFVIVYVVIRTPTDAGSGLQVKDEKRNDSMI